jgi:hypothetical protein
MFKRLSKARDLADDEAEPVSLEAALDDDSESEEDVGNSEDDEDDDDEDDSDDIFTVAQALESPIYLDDEAPGKQQIFRCVACPLMTLKTEKSIEVHVDSKVRWRQRVA